MLTIIAYHSTGYEVRIEVESEKLDTTIHWLEKHDYRPVREMNSVASKPHLNGTGPGTASATAAPELLPQTPSPGNHSGNKVANGQTVSQINDDLFGD